MLGSQIELIEMDGKEYLENNSDMFDLSICMGASWIFDNYENTLEALANITKKNGIIIVGEPFWKSKPTKWYLETTNLKYQHYGSHTENIEVGVKIGLRPIYTMVSNLDDWDRYEQLQWFAADNYVLQYPEDQDNKELLSS